MESATIDYEEQYRKELDRIKAELDESSARNGKRA